MTASKALALVARLGALGALGACTTSETSPGACSAERSTTKLVAYVPPTCTEAGAGACPDDYPPDVDQSAHTVAPLSSPFCQRHCAQFPMLVFTGCALSSLTDAGAKIVACIPAGCD